MQEYKISNFMELGDIIYILVLFSFFIFGIIKDIKKKRSFQTTEFTTKHPYYEAYGQKIENGNFLFSKKKGKKGSCPAYA